jgi:hypothetical protein
MTNALDRFAGEMFRTFARFEYALKAATVEKKAAGVRQIELGETSGLTRKPAPSCLAHEGLDC